MKAPHAVLVPLTSGNELMIAHRHTGGLLLAQRAPLPGGGVSILALGVVAAEHVAEFRAALGEPEEMAVAETTIIERHEDMSPEGKLGIFIQNDGDIVVICNGRDMWGEPTHAQVEFCTIGSGGGRSPKTRRALCELARAIIADNAEWPIREPSSPHQEPSTVSRP